MTIADGAILFLACIISFTIGYTIGAVRVTRFVSKHLDSINSSMHEITEHSRKLQQFYSRLEDDEKPKA